MGCLHSTTTRGHATTDRAAHITRTETECGKPDESRGQVIISFESLDNEAPHSVQQKRVSWTAEAPSVYVIDGISADDRRVDPSWARLCVEDKVFICKELNDLKATMEVHPDSTHMTRYHPDGPTFPEFQSSLGARVRVKGYPGQGTLTFYGPHKSRPGHRCGVIMDEPVGRNNGVVEGVFYYSCKENHGLLVTPTKVSFVDPELQAFASECQQERKAKMKGSKVLDRQAKIRALSAVEDSDALTILFVNSVEEIGYGD